MRCYVCQYDYSPALSPTRRTWLVDEKRHSSITAATVVRGVAKQAQAMGPVLGLLLDVVVFMLVVLGVVVEGSLCGLWCCAVRGRRLGNRILIRDALSQPVANMQDCGAQLLLGTSASLSSACVRRGGWRGWSRCWDEKCFELVTVRAALALWRSD